MANQPNNASNELEITQDGQRYFMYVNNNLTQPLANGSQMSYGYITRPYISINFDFYHSLQDVASYIAVFWGIGLFCLIHV